VIAGFVLAARCPGHDKIDLAATALGTDEPLAPVENRSVRAVSGSHLGGVRLDLIVYSVGRACNLTTV